MTQAPKLELLQGEPIFTTAYRAFSEGISGQGVISTGDLALTADSNTAMGYLVASGSVWYNGAEHTLSSQHSSTLSSADADNDRWDTIAFDTSTDSVVEKTGTAESNPTPPDIGTDEFLIGYIYVAAGSSDFGSGDVHDFRAMHQPAGEIQYDDSTGNFGETTVDGALDDLQEAAQIGTYPLGLDEDTDMDVDSTDLTDGATVLYESANGFFRNEVVQALANLTGDEQFSQHPLGSTDLAADAVTAAKIAAGAVGTTQLDLSIAPTWTGTHTFNANTTIDDTLSLNDQAADPSSNGDVQLNGTDVKIYSGGSVRNVSNIGSGSGSPGGSDTQLQYNNAGSFGGISDFTYDGTNLSSITDIDDTLAFIDQAADPSANGEVQLNGTDVKIYSGGSVRNVSNIGSGSGGSEVEVQEDGTSLTTDVTLIDVINGITATEPTADEIDLNIDEAALKDGGTNELDAAELAAGLGTSGQVLQSDGAAASWGSVTDTELGVDPFEYDPGIVEWADGLSNEEVARIVLQSGETLVIERIEFRQKGGGSSTSASIDVRDTTAASTIGSQDLGGTTKDPGSSGTANTVIVRVNNSTGSTVNANPRVSGYITGV